MKIDDDDNKSNQNKINFQNFAKYTNIHKYIHNKYS